MRENVKIKPNKVLLWKQFIICIPEQLQLAFGVSFSGPEFKGAPRGLTIFILSLQIYGFTSIHFKFSWLPLCSHVSRKCAVNGDISEVQCYIWSDKGPDSVLTFSNNNLLCQGAPFVKHYSSKFFEFVSAPEKALRHTETTIWMLGFYLLWGFRSSPFSEVHHVQPSTCWWTQPTIFQISRRFQN